MSQSLVQFYTHIVFSTKDRYHWFQNDENRQHLHAYLAAVCNRHDCPALEVGGPTDHVHVACRLSKKISLVELVRELKRSSSLWLKDLSPNFKGFHWQSGYGAFSVSPGHVEALVEYIAIQEEHHLRVTYQEEFRRLCQKYGLSIDEKYAWD